MLDQRCYRLRKAAAAESLQRIRRDRAKAPKAVKRALAYIERHLFDPTLSVTRLKEALGVRDNSFSTVVRYACGRSPRRYIEDRRFETACGLLAAAELSVWQIAELVGFSNFQSFGRAFSRWAGETPGHYRKQARGRSAGGRSETSFLRQIETAPLTREQVNALWRRIDAGCEEARRQLIAAHLPLVVSMARKYTGRGLPLLDLIQEGNIGLMKAIERFDSRRGSRFRSYAALWIRHEMLGALDDQARPGGVGGALERRRNVPRPHPPGYSRPNQSGR